MNVEYATVSQINKEGFRFGFCIQRCAPKAHTGAAPKYIYTSKASTFAILIILEDLYSPQNEFSLCWLFTVEGLAIPAHYPPITALTSCVNGVIEACPHVNNQQEIPLASKSANF